MSIDDLGRSAAQDLRATAAGTFDVDGGLERIPVSSRRRTVAQQGSAFAILVLVLIVGAFAIRPYLGAAPEPVDSPTPTPTVSNPTPVPTPSPSVSHGTPAPAPAGPFEALVIRGTSLVAIDVQGHERTVRDLAPLGISARDLRSGYVSTAGWLTFEPGGAASKAAIGHEFVNLRDPRAKPVLVRGLFDQRAWSPDGTRLATKASGNIPVIIDAATGARTALETHGMGLPGAGPDVIWTADGTGIIVSDTGGRKSPAFLAAHLYVAPVDGGPLQNTVPDVWESGVIATGGLQLDHEPCFMPNCPAGKVAVLDSTGVTTTWYDGDLPGTKLADATLSSDGRSAYILLASATPNQVQIARTDAGRNPSVLATVPVVTTAGAGLGISPDGSSLIVYTITDPNGPQFAVNEYVVPMDGSPSYVVDGSLAGWVPTDVANAIAAAR
jgi:hypothetical protein